MCSLVAGLFGFILVRSFTILLLLIIGNIGLKITLRDLLHVLDVLSDLYFNTLKKMALLKSWY